MNLKSILVCGTALIALGIVPAAYAQAASPDDIPAPQSEAGLDEIIVTAQKRSQSANDVGITINAFTGDTLKARGALTAEDIATFTPALTVSTTSALGVPSYSIRGVGFQDYSTGASSTVGLYFDEVSLPYAVMTRGTIFDLQRVEVLKGPQGDLYGRNTTAGQINFISNRPTRDFAAGFTVSYGRFGTFDGEGYVSGPLTENIRGRLAAKVVESSSGWQKSLTRDDRLGKKNSVALRGLLDIDLSDNATLQLNAHWIDDHSENQAPTPFDGTNKPGIGQATALPLPGPVAFSEGDTYAADWNPGDLRPKRNNRLAGTSARLDWDLGGINLTALGSYDNFKRDERNDWDGTIYRDSQIRNRTNIDAVSAELRLTSKQNDGFNWIAGVFYSYDRLKETYDYDLSESFYGTALGLNQISNRYEQRTEAIAAYGHAELQLAPKLQLVLGGRFTHERRSWRGCTYDVDGSFSGFWNALGFPGLTTGGCGTLNDIDDANPATPAFDFGFGIFDRTIKADKFMGKISLNYKPSDNVLLYASASSGFKSGGFNGAVALTFSQLEPYGPERLNAYEAGIKATLFNRSLQFNAAAFYYDYRQKQERQQAVTPVGGIGGQTNVPRSRILGAEVDIHWMPVKGLTIDAGGSYLDSKVTEWQAVDTDASSWPNTIVTFDASGLRLAQSPKWQGNLTVEYRSPLTDALDWTVGGDMTTTSAFVGVTGAERFRTAVEGYTLFNARAGIVARNDRWRFMVWGKNLTDKYYYTAAFIGGNGPYVRMNGLPATYGATFSFRY